MMNPSLLLLLTQTLVLGSPSSVPLHDGHNTSSLNISTSADSDSHKDQRELRKEETKRNIRDSISRLRNQTDSSGGLIPPPAPPSTTEIFFPDCESDGVFLAQIPTDPCMAAQLYDLQLPAGSPGSQTRLDSAHLRLSLLGTEAETLPSLRVTVRELRLQRSASRSQASPREPVWLNSKVVNNTEGGQVKLDVTEAVRLWQLRVSRPLGLILQVEDLSKRSLVPDNYLQPHCEPGTRVDPTRQPRMEISLSPGTKQTDGENLPERTGSKEVIGKRIILTREQAEREMADRQISPEELYRDIYMNLTSELQEENGRQEIIESRIILTRDQVERELATGQISPEELYRNLYEREMMKMT